MSTTCSTQDCGSPVIAHGLCRRHYWQQRRAAVRQQKCKVPVCDRPQFCGELCRGHYARARKGKDVTTPLSRRAGGNVTVTCRISEAAHDLLLRHSRASGLSVGTLAARFILRELGIAE